jgi:hypothetical protein
LFPLGNESVPKGMHPAPRFREGADYLTVWVSGVASPVGAVGVGVLK